MSKLGLDINRLKSTSVNNVKVYSIARHRSLPSWITPKKLKSLRKDKDYRERLDLIQDLWFETATTKIKVTPDGEYIVASGIYPPQMKVYMVRELAMKFERHFTSDIVNFQLLDDDYSKIAFLCADRSVCLHAKYGSHYSLRIPRMGRDLIYDNWSCDLICAASSPDLYRINLEQGRFLPSLSTHSPAVNVVSRSTIHGLIAGGGSDGAVEFFDSRTKSSICRMDVATTADVDLEVRSLQFDADRGYYMAAGTSAGKVMIYDLRSSLPVMVMDHKNNEKVIDIKWHRTPNSPNSKLISADRFGVRIWDCDTGYNFTSISPDPDLGMINDVCIIRDSGLILLAQDRSRISPYFIPALGPAPRWCSHLDNITEELEESSEVAIYDNFKFVTKEDLDRLNLTHLIGTPYLKTSFHGFFINYQLYKKAMALANPFAYDEYREKKKQEKMEAERASRITKKVKLPKVNRGLAARLLDDQETEAENTKGETTARKSSKKNKRLGSELLKDDRFAGLFENKDFEVDELSTEYLALHPQVSKKQPSLLDEHFEPVMEDESEEAPEKSTSDASTADVEQESDEEQGRQKKRSKAPRLYEVKDERHADAFYKSVSLAEEDALPLEYRVASLQKHQQKSSLSSDVKLGPGGSREISFISRNSAKYMEDEGQPHPGKRRGIQSLGLKPNRFDLLGRGSGRGRGRGRHGKHRR